MPTAPNKVKLNKTPPPPSPPAQLAFSSAMNYLDGRQVADALDEINEDTFVPKTFSSATNSEKNKTNQDAAAKPKTQIASVESNDDPIFNQNVSASDNRSPC